MFVFGVIAFTVLAIVAIFSTVLISGISEKNATKVNRYKTFLIIKLVIFIIGFLIIILDAGRYIDLPTITKTELITSGLLIIVCLYYEIHVIDSLELMYREQTLPTIQQQCVINQNYPHLQAPDDVTQFYYPQPNQDFNHLSVSFSIDPPSYTSLPPNKNSSL